MADNVESASGSGGATFATDDIAGVHFPRVKLIHGADGTNDGDVAAANPLPVEPQGKVAENAAASGAQPLQVAGRYDAAPRTLDDGDQGAIALDADGAVHISDGGNSVTVDGTVTANLGATDNAVLDAIAAAVEIMDDWDETNRAAVNLIAGQAGITGGAGAVGASTPRVVLASDDPAVALLGTIDADTSTLAGAVTGNEMQVDVVAALPAGTNAIGKLAANSGVDIGDVDVLSVVPGSGATNLGKAEDAVHASGDVGVMALAVRTDSPANKSGANGDYEPLQISAGRVWTSGVVTSISAGANLIGDVGLSGARTSGGATPYKNLDVDESEDEVKGTAGQVYFIHAINLASTVRYLKLYNATAATVVVGTTTPVLTFPIPTQGDSNGAGFMLSIPNGIAFGTAITIAATTGLADADTGAPGANEVVVNIGYA